jgi:hypothetical protein
MSHFGRIIVPTIFKSWVFFFWRFQTAATSKIDLFREIPLDHMSSQDQICSVVYIALLYLLYIFICILSLNYLDLGHCVIHPRYPPGVVQSLVSLEFCGAIKSRRLTGSQHGHFQLERTTLWELRCHMKGTLRC